MRTGCAHQPEYTLSCPPEASDISMTWNMCIQKEEQVVQLQDHTKFRSLRRIILSYIRTSDSDGIYISEGENAVSRQIQVNLTVVLVVSRDVFSHCQHAGASWLGQVVSILDLNGSIAGEQCQTRCIRTITSPPQKPLRKGNTHSLNTTGGSAVEGKGIVRSHIGETSGVGSEGDSQGWDCIVRGENGIYSCIVKKVCTFLNIPQSCERVPMGGAPYMSAKQAWVCF